MESIDAPFRRTRIIAATTAAAAATGCAALGFAAPASADPPNCIQIAFNCIDPSLVGIQDQQPQEKPPVDQTRVLIVPQGLSVKVVVEDLSNLATRCTYRADPVDNFLLPPVSRDFSMSPRGRQEFTFLAPPIGSTYHLVTSCHGTFNGQDVEVGHVEQDLPGGYLGG
jgi:hypothetical protein